MNVIESIEDSGDTSQARFSRRRELAFVLPGIKNLQLVPTKDEDPGIFLAHQIARDPEDLRAHVQRIYLHIAAKNAEEIYGALVDLFIVLGAKGSPLRHRMLAVSKKFLDREQYQTLVRKLDTGVHAADTIPPAPASMLTRGTRGTHFLVERLSTHAAGLLDPLDEARSYLEYGQLEEARELLEDAVMNEPWRLELHRELLEIYRATLDLDSFSTMWKLVDAANNPAADAWAETAEILSTQVMSGE